MTRKRLPFLLYTATETNLQRVGKEVMDLGVPAFVLTYEDDVWTAKASYGRWGAGISGKGTTPNAALAELRKHFQERGFLE